MSVSGSMQATYQSGYLVKNLTLELVTQWVTNITNFSGGGELDNGINVALSFVLDQWMLIQVTIQPCRPQTMTQVNVLINREHFGAFVMK